MEYREAVAEARTLVKRSEEDQWRLAELTWQQLRQNGVTARQWAQDIGVSYSHAGALARVWEQVGVQALHTRPRFAEAYEMAMNPGRLEEGGSKHAGQAMRAVRNMPPEQKAEVVREALAEPEVVERIVRDTPTRARIAKAEHTVDREQQDTARERYELEEPRSVQIGAMADAEYGLTKIRTTAEDVSEAVDKLIAYNWPDNSKERTEVLVQRAAAAVEMIRAKVDGRDLDQELQALLEGGEG